MLRIESKPSAVEGHPMKKRTCRRIAVMEVDVAALVTELGSGRVVFALDVAKVEMVLWLTQRQDQVPPSPLGVTR
jgi:hypothetical protein